MLNESESKSLNRVMYNSSRYSFGIISACRGNLTDSENSRRTSTLRGEIKDNGFSYTPLLGGFIEENNGEVVEDSFIVWNADRNGKEQNEDSLFDFLSEECVKYDQDSFLWSSIDDDFMYYIDQNGNIDSRFSKDKTTFSDFTSRYFSRLKKSNRFKRFSFNEFIVSEPPKTLNEQHRRSLKGELFLRAEWKR